MRSHLVVAALLVACGAPPKPTTPPGGGSGSQTAPASPDDAALPLWSDVRRGVLPNGLTYYVLPHHKPEKRAYLWLAVNAGSVQEDDDQRGLAHFDEHMAFNGTKNFPKGEIVSYLQSIGMRFGADLNARTKFDDTVYELEVPTDNPQFIAKGFDILHDWAGDASYDPAEVEKERGVVLEEWRLNRNAGMRLFAKHSQAMLKGSRYPDRIPIGLPEIIKGAPRDALHRFYKDWYRPDLMAVIAVGDFDPAQIQAEIEKKFGDLAGPAKERPRTVAGVPKGEGTRISIETDRELPNAFIQVVNLMPHRPEASLNDYRRMLTEQIYIQILNERFASIARKPEAPFVGAGVRAQSEVREIDTFERLALAKGGNVDDALRALFTEVLRIERHGVTASELERARANISRGFEELATTEATKDGRDLAEEITRHFFEKELMVGSQKEKEFALKILPAITVDDLNRLNKSYGGAENRAILISGPDGQPLPTKERVLAIVDEVAKSKIEPWEDKVSTQPLMAQAPAPGKIVAEKKVDKIGVTEWTLGNGARVIVKPTDFEKDAVALVGVSPGGLAEAKDAEFPSARFADDMAALGGAGELDAETLGKLLTGKHAEATASIEDTTESVAAAGSAKDIETIFQLAYMRMALPRRDQTQFDVWKRNAIEQLETRRRVPEVQFAIEARAIQYKNNPRVQFPEPKDIAKIDLDKALGFYKSRFGDVSDFTFVLVGDFTLDQVKPLVETYLASLPGKGRKEKEIDLGIREVGGVVVKTWTLGEEPKARVSIEFHGDEPWSRDKDRDMAILGMIVGMRLHDVLREDMGGVYGVGAEGRISRSPHQERSFDISFGCAPDNVDKLVKAVFTEIAAIQKDGIGPEYLEKTKAQFIRERETAMRTNAFWVDWLARAYRFGDDPTIITDPAGIVARMTSDNVKASAKRYLDAKQYFQAVLLPAKK